MRKLEDNIKVNEEKDWVEWELEEYLFVLYAWGDSGIIPNVRKYHSYRNYTASLYYN